MTVDAATETERKLLQRAQDAFNNAHAPYTKNATGAAALTSSGKVFVGCKVEMVSFGGTVCAEQSAIASAVAAGSRDIEVLAIYPAFNPCGLCRQVMLEFNAQMTLIFEQDGAIRRVKLPELLPHGFGPENLLKD